MLIVHALKYRKKIFFKFFRGKWRHCSRFK